MKIRLHPHATAETLAAARILIACLWIARLVPDPIHRLGHLPAEFWWCPRCSSRIPNGRPARPGRPLGAEAVLLGALAGMHVAIALLMNIVFIENVLLLALFVDYTPWLRTALSPRHPQLETPPG